MTVSQTVRDLLLATCIAGLSGHTTSLAHEDTQLVLVDQGRPQATIILPDDLLLIGPSDDPQLILREKQSTRTQRYAAEQLQRFIQKATGAELPIVAASEAPSEGSLILIGRSALTEQRGITPPTATEGIRITSFPGGVALLGEIAPIGTNHLTVEHDRGTAHAVTFFLEEYLGFRFYFSDPIDGDEDFGIVMPASDTLAIPTNIDHTSAPAYSFRFTYGFFGSEILMGNPRLMPVGHTDDGWMHRYRNTHPDYFRLRENGARDFKFLCYSEPSVLEQRLEHITQWYEEDRRLPGLLPSQAYISVTPADNLGHCHCARCLAGRQHNPVRHYRHQQPGWGTQSNIYFSHIRDLALEVQKRWPGKRVVTLAYQGYTLPPDFKLPDNVDIVLCPLVPSYLYKEPEARQRVHELILAWHKALDQDRERLLIWDYPVFPGLWTAAPILYPRVKQQWLKDFAPYVSGEYLNSRGRAAQESHWFINLWFRMLWNPDLDVEAYLADYCHHFFGPAAEPMEKFYRLAIDHYEQTVWSEHAVEYGAGLYRGLYGETYTPAVIQQMAGAFQEALVAVSTRGSDASNPHDSLYRRRVFWMRDWLEQFSAEYGPRQSRMGFFVEARQAHRWLDHVPTYHARRVTSPPEADFQAEAWLSAPTTYLVHGKDDLRHGRDPFDRLGFPADLPTRIQVLYDRRHLYVAIRCSQPFPATAKDTIGVSFHEDSRLLFQASFQGDNTLTTQHPNTQAVHVEGPGWWGVFLTFPIDQAPIFKRGASVRANFTRLRSRMPQDGDAASGPAPEIPLPEGAESPAPTGDTIAYTWSPLVEGNLGWGGYPWRRRGILHFD